MPDKGLGWVLKYINREAPWRARPAEISYSMPGQLDNVLREEGEWLRAGESAGQEEVRSSSTEDLGNAIYRAGR